MQTNKHLFDRVLIELDKAGVLTEMMLIGSWVLPVYREYFHNPPEIPLLRTTDLDFLISNPPKIKKSCDISNILKRLSFEKEISVMGGFVKFVHPELEVEFLIPELGRGQKTAYSIRELGISAQPLRYMNIFYDFKLIIEYNNIRICVPEPAVFALMKFLISTKRKDTAKIKKDISTAIQLTDYLLQIPDQQRLFLRVYNIMPKGWQKSLKQILDVHYPSLLKLFEETTCGTRKKTRKINSSH